MFKNNLVKLALVLRCFDSWDDHVETNLDAMFYMGTARIGSWIPLVI